MSTQATPGLGVGSNALLGAIVSADEYSSQWPRCLRIVTLRMDEAESLLDETESLRAALESVIAKDQLLGCTATSGGAQVWHDGPCAEIARAALQPNDGVHRQAPCGAAGEE